MRVREREAAAARAITTCAWVYPANTSPESTIRATARAIFVGLSLSTGLTGACRPLRMYGGLIKAAKSGNQYAFARSSARPEPAPPFGCLPRGVQTLANTRQNIAIGILQLGFLHLFQLRASGTQSVDCASLGACAPRLAERHLQLGILCRQQSMVPNVTSSQTCSEQGFGWGPCHNGGAPQAPSMCSHADAAAGSGSDADSAGSAAPAALSSGFEEEWRVISVRWN